MVTPLKRSRTSAAPVGLRASEPLKMTSSIFSPRRLFALCSPITHVSASATLLLPHPLGPTIAVTPRSKESSERSENDLKPAISRRSRRMYGGPCHCEVRSWSGASLASPARCGKDLWAPNILGWGLQQLAADQKPTRDVRLFDNSSSLSASANWDSANCA